MPRPPIPLLLVPLALAASFAGPSSTAQAQLEPPALVDARTSLTPYGERTLIVLDELDAFAERTTRSAHRREARYLRAMAATDLAVIAHRHGDARLLQRLAETMAAPPSGLRALLERELRAVRVGHLRAQIDDALNALNVLDGESPDWRRAGARRDALFADAVFRALRAEGVERLEALAELAPDPCPARCAAPYAPFDPVGRRAVAGVEEAFDALERLDAHSGLGDPLARALADDVLIDRVALGGVELAPRVASWGPAGDLTRIGGEAEPGETPGALLRVSAAGVSLAYAPRVSFDPGGRPRLVGAGPLPDAPARVDFPEEPRPFIRPIDEVVALLRSIPEGVTLALGASPEVPTHLLYRVIESAQAADVPVDAIAAASADGRLHTRPLEVRHEWPESHVKVFVRLGGYTVSVGRRRMELARRRTETGWEHDTARLRQTVAGADRPLALRAMWAAPASLVLEAAFAEAASEPFAVVIR